MKRAFVNLSLLVALVLPAVIEVKRETAKLIGDNAVIRRITERFYDEHWPGTGWRENEFALKHNTFPTGNEVIFSISNDRNRKAFLKAIAELD